MGGKSLDKEKAMTREVSNEHVFRQITAVADMDHKTLGQLGVTLSEVRVPAPLFDQMVAYLRAKAESFDDGAPSFQYYTSSKGFIHFIRDSTREADTDS
jgi:hypothetical protein